MAVMKESLDNGEISKLIRVESKGMIADFLTKTKKDGHRGPYWNYYGGEGRSVSDRTLYRIILVWIE